MLKKAIQHWKDGAQYLKRVVTQPSSELNRWQKVIRFNYELTRHCTHELIHDKAGQMAAALTYHTLLSLPPMIIVMMAVFFSLKGMDQYRDMFKNTIITAVVPEAAPIPDSAETTDETSAEDAATTQASEENKKETEKDRKGFTSTFKINMAGLFSGKKIELPTAPAASTQPASKQEAVAKDDKRDEQALALELEKEKLSGKEAQNQEVAKNIRQKVDEIFAYFENVSFEAIGVAGFLFFIWGSTGLLATIERSFNSIFNVRKSRPWYLRMTYYYTCISLAPAVIIGGIIIQNSFYQFLSSMEITRWMAGPIAMISPLTTTWLVLFVLYKFLPNTRVTVRAAMIGSLIAAIGWVIGKEGYAVYLKHSAGTRSIYGALALFPLTLVWVWITWLVILFGLELSYALQTITSRDYRKLAHKANEETWTDISWSIPITVYLAAAFQKGKFITTDEMVQKTQLSKGLVNSLMKCLEDHQLIHKAGDEQEQWCLARPADQIKVIHILDAARTLLPFQGRLQSDEAWNFLRSLERHQVDLVEGTTLNELSKYARPEDGSSQSDQSSTGALANA